MTKIDAVLARLFLTALKGDSFCIGFVSKNGEFICIPMLGNRRAAELRFFKMRN
jgi:hypothetical protein